MSAISVKNLTKEFPIYHQSHHTLKDMVLQGFGRKKETLKVLDDVSFDVKEGEFLGIIGRNGCGKSTLLKILAGIYQPTAGSVKINGRLSPFLELGVGFQPELTAWENIFLYGSLLGMTEKQINAKVDEIIAFSELEKFIDTKVKNFSSGMVVRLAFSTAIQADFDILLLDEVLAVGDMSFQQKCFQKFYEFKKYNKTIIFVSHSLTDVKNHCKKSMLVEKGKIIYQGDPEKTINEYYKLNPDQTEIKTEPNKDISEDIYGSFEVKLTKIKINSKNILKTNKLSTSNENVISLTIDNKKNIKQLSFGLGLRDKHGDVVITERIQVYSPNAEEVKFFLPKNIPSGQYFLSLAITDSSMNYVYEHHKNLYLIKLK